jgi:hypothetical protein
MVKWNAHSRVLFIPTGVGYNHAHFNRTNQPYLRNIQNKTIFSHSFEALLPCLTT